MIILVMFVLALCLSTQPVFSAPHEERNLKQQRFFIHHGGLERSYFLFVPATYRPEKAAPLLFLLHGGGGIGRRMLSFTGFDLLAEREGIIVVSPDGIERHWNDGRAGTGYKAHNEGVDDVGYIAALIDKISSEYKVDKKRIFAAGISNGGMMSYRLGMEIPHRIAAIAPVVAAVPESLSHELSTESKRGRPSPAIIFNGTADPLVPFDGGDVHLHNRKLGRVLSVPESVRLWSKRMGCSGKPKVSYVPVKDEGMKVSKTEYDSCSSRSSGISANTNASASPSPSANTNLSRVDLILYTIEGGGHTWPGPEPSTQYLPERLIGRACHDLNATELIWNFFQTHQLQEKDLKPADALSGTIKHEAH